MSVPFATSPSTTGDVTGSRGAATAALAAAVLGFFVITLDATVVNVALPAVRDDFGGGMTGLQWVLDSYTLMFAALLLSAGAVSDRIGAHRAFGTGMAVFVAASVACGLAPNVGVLIAARAVQGAGAATMLPASLALIREAFPDSVRRARAIAVWTIAGSVAAAAGPVSGGALSLASWRMIFFINMPVGVAALFLLARAVCSPRRPVPFDWTRQVAAVVALGALAFAVAAVAAAAFVAAQVRGKHPMVPMDLLRSRTMRIASANGFAFIAGLNGTVFLYSLCLQQERGLSALAVGLVCLPMAALSAFLGVPTVRPGSGTGRACPSSVVFS
jgi:DHA2 family methylenomycin A resistance protein-like MFS transporter